jgi:hypothetical protein
MSRRPFERAAMFKHPGQTATTTTTTTTRAKALQSTIDFTEVIRLARL